MGNTIEPLYLNKQNKKSDQKTLRLEDTREGIQMINTHIKRWLMPYVVKKMQTRYPLAHLIECSQHFRTLIGPSMGKVVTHHEYSFTVGRSKNYCNHFGRQLGSLLHMTQQSTAVVYHTELETYIHTKLSHECLWHLLITDKTWSKNRVFLGRLQLFFSFFVFVLALWVHATQLPN